MALSPVRGAARTALARGRTGGNSSPLAMAAPTISSRQRAHLRSLAHPLRPVVQIGGSGLTDGIVEATDVALAEHELIKVKIGQGFDGDRREAARELAERTRADLTQVIGRVVVLYRPRPPRGGDPRPRIVLPPPAE